MTSFTFDSSDLHQDQSFDAYRAIYAGGSDVETSGTDFRARIEAKRLGKLVMFDRQLNDVTHERSLRRAGIDSFEHFVLQLNLSGQLLVETPSDRTSVGAGEVILFDMTKPQRTTLVDCHYLTFSVAPDIVAILDNNVDGLHGTVLDGQKSSILADMMVSLTRRSVPGEPTAARRVTQMFRQALALALETDEQSHPRDASEAMERVKLLVNAHLAERELSPEWIANKANLSRTRLYELFKPAGGISRYLQKTRAAKLRQLLTMPEMGRFSISALCHQVGFASESHAIRTFSEFFSIAPGQYRRQLGDKNSSTIAEFSSDFNSWIRALSVT